MSSDITPCTDAAVASEETQPKQSMAVQNPVQGGAPEKQFQNFMNPMFAELEQRVKEQEAVLDAMNDRMKAEREEENQARRQAHIPAPLKGRGQSLSSVMKTVEDMMLYEIEEDKATIVETKEENKLIEQQELKEGEIPVDNRVPMTLKKLDDIGNAAVTSHSLAAYVGCLKEDHLKKFTAKVKADCLLWLSKMYRFEDMSAWYHEDPRDGLVRVCRLALYQKYPKYITEGFEALYSRPPVIYMSSATEPGLSSYICLQLGLPMSSVCTVPCNTLFGASSKMDTEILEKLIQDDIAAAKTPVALLAYAGTPTLGHVDDIEKIQELCKKNAIWLHIEGNSLATLALINSPSELSPARLGDSITISLGKWLGVPALPHATLFKESDPTLVHASGLNTFNPSTKLHCLPLWVTLQSLGIESIEERIKDSCNLAQVLFEELEKKKCIKQISRDVQKKEKTIRSITDLISKAITALMIVDMVTPTVVFKYHDEEEANANVAVAPYAMGSGIEEDEDKDEERKRKQQYFNALNEWLSDSLQAENPQVQISTIEVEREGVCIRFAPLESAQVLGTNDDHIKNFVKTLTSQITILDSTVLNYEKFRIIVTSEENLRIVEVPNWAGLGAVQYIPNEYLEKLESLSDKEIQEINNLNIELVHKLKTTDMAFSLGYTDANMACVKFGLITEETDVEELVTMVQTVGKEVQESSKYMESMSELIRKGIDEANKDLQVENQNKLQQEGVLRQIPLVGSMVNWWSPPPKDIMKGRTFNLVSGTIGSTEETYKYKIQVQTGGINGTPSRSPRSRPVSESGSIDSQGHPGHAAPTSPLTKTAGDVKATLTSVTEGDLSEGQESLPSPNGNLSLNLGDTESEVKVPSS